MAVSGAAAAGAGATGDLSGIGRDILDSFLKRGICSSQHILSRAEIGYNFSDDRIKECYAAYGPPFVAFLNYSERLERIRYISRLMSADEPSPFAGLALDYSRTDFGIAECKEAAVFALVEALARGVDKVAIVIISTSNRGKVLDSYLDTSQHCFTILGMTHAEVMAAAGGEKHKLGATLAKMGKTIVVDPFFNFVAEADQVSKDPAFTAYVEAYKITHVTSVNYSRECNSVILPPAEKAKRIQKLAESITKKVKGCSFSVVLGFDPKQYLALCLLKELKRVFPTIGDRWKVNTGCALGVAFLGTDEETTMVVRHLEGHGCTGYKVAKKGEGAPVFGVMALNPSLKALELCPVYGGGGA